MLTRYAVRLHNGSIEYIATYKCAECGWVDNDPSFFWYYAGKNYCSLHKEGESE